MELKGKPTMKTRCYELICLLAICWLVLLFRSTSLHAQTSVNLSMPKTNLVPGDSLVLDLEMKTGGSLVPIDLYFSLEVGIFTFYMNQNLEFISNRVPVVSKFKPMDFKVRLYGPSALFSPSIFGDVKIPENAQGSFIWTAEILDFATGVSLSKSQLFFTISSATPTTISTTTSTTTSTITTTIPSTTTTTSIATTTTTTFPEASPRCGSNIFARVTKVIDGDTIVLDNGEHVRLLGVDTPELDTPCGKVAAKFTEDNLLNRTIRLEVSCQNPRDSFGRILALVYVDGILFNTRLLEEGLAETLFIQTDLFNPSEWTAIRARARDGCNPTTTTTTTIPVVSGNGSDGPGCIGPDCTVPVRGHWRRCPTCPGGRTWVDPHRRRPPRRRR